ncbi:MAG: hypothetical protein QF437_28415 [Planctomycetota bacterium]|nr:hypothetical protein [Planctomycetota bacterium]
MNTPLIDQHYGNNLDEMEEVISQIVEQYFVDEDGILIACINANTNRPFVDDDPEVRDIDLTKAWFANGALPHELKRTCLNYEDSDMATGELLMAYLARARATDSQEHIEAVEGVAGAMIHLSETVAEKNPFGPGWLPKIHGGLKHVHECFETSADQYLKWSTALEAYGAFTKDADRKARVDRILLDMAQWLDAHDFATPYMGNTNYARLNHLRHYHVAFAYLCALGHSLGGDSHLMEEVEFFKDRALIESKPSPSPNSQNLVSEAIGRLLVLAPEHRDAWLNLIRDDWEARHNFVETDGRIRFSGHYWNHTTRLATNYLVIRNYLPEIEGSLDVESILRDHDCKSTFLHLAPGQKLTGPFLDGNYPRYDKFVHGFSYASWLRVYWETRGAN